MTHHAPGMPPSLNPKPEYIPSLPTQPFLFAPLLLSPKPQDKLCSCPGMHRPSCLHTPAHSPLACAQGSYLGPLGSHSTLGMLAHDHSDIICPHNCLP